MNTSLAAPLKHRLIKVLPGGLVHQIAFELQTAYRMAFKRRDARRYASMQGVCLNIGCGSRPTEGWVNLDLMSYPGVEYWDCRKGLPFGDGTVKAIFSEHVLEHMEYGHDVQTFLGECLRCLEPGGVFRVIVPDAGVYLKLYCEGRWDEIMARRPLIQEGESYVDYWLGQRYSTKMEFINAVFRQNGEHKYAYDAETLIRLVKRAGFGSVREATFGESLYPDMAPDTMERGPESLFIEAIKGASASVLQ
jgi:predicted SAM-dependent methyltransferase